MHRLEKHAPYMYQCKAQDEDEHLCKLDADVFVLPSIPICAHLGHKSCGGVSDSMCVHQSQAIGVILWSPDVFAILSQRPSESFAIKPCGAVSICLLLQGGA